jgi:hypothetical protein
VLIGHNALDIVVNMSVHRAMHVTGINTPQILNWTVVHGSPRDPVYYTLYSIVYSV